MGNSFVLFDVSMEISRRQFHFGQIGHTKKCFPAGKSHLPKGKMARVTAAIVGPNMLRAFAHHVVCCCDLLDEV